MTGTGKLFQSIKSFSIASNWFKLICCILTAMVFIVSLTFDATLVAFYLVGMINR